MAEQRLPSSSRGHQGWSDGDRGRRRGRGFEADPARVAGQVRSVESGGVGERFSSSAVLAGTDASRAKDRGARGAATTSGVGSAPDHGRARTQGMVTSTSSVYRCLRRAGPVVADGRRRRRREWQRWERGRPMELWRFDVFGRFLLADGRYVMEQAPPLTAPLRPTSGSHVGDGASVWLHSESRSSPGSTTP